MEHAQALPRAGAAPESGQLENGLIWLNTAAVVDRIIRDFTREILPLVAAGKMPELMFECRRMNGLFLGETPTDKYARGPWNSPDQLGEYVLKALRIDGETRLAVRDAFTWYVSKLLDAIDLDAPFDEEAVEPIIDELRNALLGLSDGSPDYVIDAE